MPAILRFLREHLKEKLLAAQSSPEAAAELEAFLEEDGAHGLVMLAALCETAEPIQQRLARLTADAVDPAVAAARLVDRTLGRWRGRTDDGPMTALAAASLEGNTPMLSFLLTQPGVDPDDFGFRGSPPLTAAASV